MECWLEIALLLGVPVGVVLALRPVVNAAWARRERESGPSPEQVTTCSVLAGDAPLPGPRSVLQTLTGGNDDE